MPRDDEPSDDVGSFDDAADAYLESDTHREGDDLERLAAWCTGASDALDVATGAGHTAGAIAERGVPRVVATDASPRMVATALEAFAGLEGVVADAARLPFDKSAFDAVACRIAAHHFPAPEAFVDEVARVLRPGGTFAFEDTVAPEDPAVDALLDRVERLRDPTHVRSYPTRQWRDRLAERGFDLEAVHHMRTTLEFESWVDRLSPSPSRRDRVESILLEAPEDVKAALEVVVEDGSVVSFVNRKMLIRARSTL